MTVPTDDHPSPHLHEPLLTNENSSSSSSSSSPNCWESTLALVEMIICCPIQLLLRVMVCPVAFGNVCMNCNDAQRPVSFRISGHTLRDHGLD